jgi:hypothetical protein
MEMFCCSPSFFEALGMDQLYTALNYDTTFGHKFYVHCASANLFIFKQKPLHLVFVTMSQRKLQSSHEAGLELILGLNPNLRQCRAASRDLEQGIANALQAKFPFAIIFSDGKHVWSLLSEKFEKDDVPKPMRRYIEQRLTAALSNDRALFDAWVQELIAFSSPYKHVQKFFIQTLFTEDVLPGLLRATR